MRISVGGVLHHVGELRAAEQCEPAAHGECVERAAHRGVQVEVSGAVDCRALFSGHVEELEVGGAQLQVGGRAGEVREVHRPVDRERPAVGRQEGEAVEGDAPSVEADRVAGQAEGGADHRNAELCLREGDAAVEARGFGLSVHPDAAVERARKAEQVGRQEGVEALQRQSGIVHSASSGSPAAVAGAGRQERVGVECQEGVGLPDASLGIGGADPDIAEAGPVVGHPGSRHRALHREAVGRQPELHAGCERAAYGWSFGQQLQRAGDVDPRDVEPHAVGESGAGTVCRASRWSPRVSSRSAVIRRPRP